MPLWLVRWGRIEASAYYWEVLCGLHLARFVLRRWIVAQCRVPIVLLFIYSKLPTICYYCYHCEEFDVRL